MSVCFHRTLSFDQELIKKIILLMVVGAEYAGIFQMMLRGRILMGTGVYELLSISLLRPVPSIDRCKVVTFILSVSGNQLNMKSKITHLLFVIPILLMPQSIL